MTVAPETTSRQPGSEVDAIFVDRWSPRAFRSEPLDPDEIAALFEAARWAPSCFNEQPWRFVYATSEEDRARFTALLKPGNQTWAGRAPLLIFVVANQTFMRNDRPNRWAGFDTGAAWMSLALQARRLGLYSHAMAGVDFEAAYAELGVDPEQHVILCAVAVGRRADPESLPDEVAVREKPNDRRPAASFVFEGGMASAAGEPAG